MGLPKFIPLFERGAGMVADHKEIASQLGYLDIKKLGAGMEGTVYDVGNNKVLKISNHTGYDNDFYTIDEHIFKHPNKHFAKVFAVGTMKDYKYSIKEKVKWWRFNIELDDYLYKELKLKTRDDPILTLYDHVYKKGVPPTTLTKKYYDFFAEVERVVWKRLGLPIDISIYNVGYNNKNELVAIDV